MHNTPIPTLGLIAGRDVPGPAQRPLGDHIIGTLKGKQTA